MQASALCQKDPKRQEPRTGKKISRTLKLTAVILLAAALQVSANGIAQVSFSGRNVPLEKVFEAIRKQTGYLFLYNSNAIKKAKRVTIDMKDKPLEEVLRACLKGQPFEFNIEHRTIFIIAKKNGAPTERATDAQPVPEPDMDVGGIVVDENGLPMAGASVVVKGTTTGTSTNARGQFTLSNISEDAVLVISSVGYNQQEVPIGNNQYLRIEMKVAVGNLDELQVIAYGKTSRRFNTGNVGTVKARDIETQPVQNPMLALQGRVPGLLVTQHTGVANGAVIAEIQGRNSIFSGNDPFIVVDGVPFPATFSQTGFEGPVRGATSTGGTALSFINPADIESIDILKDADATAIYGSRAANGAILITTKRGRAGRTNVTIDLQHGWADVARKVDVLNTRQYLDMRYEALKNDSITEIPPSHYDLLFYDTTRYTDWQEELIGNTARYNTFSASATGGNTAIQYYLSGTYHRETSVFYGDHLNQRGALHVNLSGSSSDEKFRFQLSANYMADENRLPSEDLTDKALRIEPVAPPLFTDEGNLNWAITPTGVVTFVNPLATAIYQTHKNNTNNLVGNLNVSYRILPGLSIKSSFGYTNLRSDIYIPTPLPSIRPDFLSFVPRAASFGDRELDSWIIEPQLTYTRKLGKLDIDLLAGTTFQESVANNREMTGSGYSSDLLLKDIAAAAQITARSSRVTYKYNAGFGRVNMNLAGKYILSLSGRRDGSSRFGEENRFQNFGSVGAAWIFSEERFLKAGWLSFGKIRGSYGTTGNDQIGDYSRLSIYSSTFADVPYQNLQGLQPGSLFNPYLEWEVTRKLQVGMDLGFIRDRILLNVTYGRNRSSNQLLSNALPSTTGFVEVLNNFNATVQNIIWEFSLNTQANLGKKISWTSNVNLTIPRNKLVSFPNIESTPYALGFSGMIVGQPLGIQKVLPFVGVDPETGLYLVRDAKGDQTITPAIPDDQTQLVSTLPRYYGGFQNDLAFNRFRLSFLFQFVRQKGFKRLYFSNGGIYPGRFVRSFSNQPVTVLSRWQQQGDVTDIARFSSTSDLVAWAELSDAAYSYDASFIRLKNIMISFDFPERWLTAMHLQRARVYAQGQNIATITDYTGLDPETQSNIALPPLRTLVLGLQFTF